MQQEKVNLSQFDKLAKWTQRWYRRPLHCEFTVEGGVTTCTLDFSTWCSAKGTGQNQREAKAAAAADAWDKIYSGEFIGGDVDILAYEATTGQTVEVDYN